MLGSSREIGKGRVRADATQTLGDSPHGRKRVMWGSFNRLNEVQMEHVHYVWQRGSWKNSCPRFATHRDMHDNDMINQVFTRK